MFGKLLHAQPGQQAPYESSIVNTLLHRIGESFALEDRRAALLELRDVLADDPAAQTTFASLGLSTICGVIQNDMDDPTVLRTCLECMVAATGERDAAPATLKAAAVNAEQLARTKEAIPLLISLLERQAGGVDAFHVKYLTLQLLQSMLQANPAFTQQAVLQLPVAMSQFVDLLSEQEVLRNETVLLLQRLVQGNPDAQKVAAFNGCLDKVFSIIREEDFVLGGIVVEDCLHLMGDLLKGNAANQRSFYELGFHAGLMKIVQDQSAVLQKDPDEVPPEWTNNLSAALEVVEICLLDAAMQSAGGAGAAQPSSGGSVLMALGSGQQQQQIMIRMLSAFATHNSVSSSARSSAWRCLEAVLQDGQAHAWLEGSRIELGPQAGAPLALGAIHSAAFGGSPTEILTASRFAAFMCSSNSGLQSTLASQLTSGARGVADITAALFAQGGLPQLLQSSRAAAAITSLVVDNDEVKQSLLDARFAPHPVSILAACAQRLAVSVTQHGGKPEAQQLVPNYAILLAVWMHAFPPAAAAFLESIKQTPFLVGVLLSDGQFGAGGTVIRGMCAILLGLSCIYAPEGSAVDPAILKQAISGQVGFPRYGKALEDLLTSARSAAHSVDGQLAHVCWLSWLEGVVAEIMQQIMGSTPKVSRPLAVPQPVPSTNGHQQQSSPRVTVTSVPQPSYLPGHAPAAAPVQAPPVAAAPSQRPMSPTFAPGNTQKMAALEQEVATLKQQNAELEKEAASAKASLKELRASFAKAEADLEGLSTAYAALDAHASQLQEQLAAAESRSTSSTGATPAAVDIEALVQAAREEAERDASAAMEDLLVCLGQEEARVAELEAQLQKLQAPR